MFFSLSSIAQVAILWILIAVFIRNDPQTNRFHAVIILAAFFIARFFLVILFAFQFRGSPWWSVPVLSFALLYGLIWKITGTSPKSASYVWLCFVILAIGLDLCLRALTATT